MTTPLERDWSTRTYPITGLHKVGWYDDTRDYWQFFLYGREHELILPHGTSKAKAREAADAEMAARERLLPPGRSLNG